MLGLFEVFKDFDIKSFCWNPTFIIAISAVAVVSILVLYHRLYESKKLSDYYLDIIRTVSKSLCGVHEIAAFDSGGNIVYTTHPAQYSNKNEFMRSIVGRSNASASLRSFQNMLEKNINGSEILSGSGNGLSNNLRRWMAVCNIIPDDSSFIDESVSVVTLSEITKYVEDIERLERDQQRLENFLDKFPFGIFYVNNLGIIIGLNSTFAGMLMVNRDKIIGSSISDFVENFNYNITPQRPVSITIKPKFATSFKAILIKSAVQSNSSGQPWVVCKVDQRGSETSSVGDTNEFLEQGSFISAPVSSIIATTSGEIVAINPAFASLIQDRVILDKNKIMKPGANLSDFITQGGVRNNLATYLSDAHSSKENPAPIEIKFIGGEVTAMAYVNRLESTKTLHEKLLLIQLVDITGQKVLEQQFIQSQKMQAVGQLAGGIAHDFNNLLTAMIGFCDLLLQRYTANDPSYGDVIQIKQNASRAANLVRQLLAFSRRQTMQPKVISITEILAELNSLLRRLIGIDIDFQTIHGRDIWPVRVDNSQIEQVIINLAVNARDAMENIRDAKLIIKTSNYHASESFKCVFDTALSGDYILIEVSDNGVGIEDEIIESIFEPFFTKKGSKSGTGLGLSTVYGIVNQTGGFIRVESTVGVGSKFQVFLPRYMGKEEVQNGYSQEKAQTRDLTGSETILLVEDEDAVRMFSSRALRNKGYKVLEANCGEAALKIALSGEKFDLLITDVIMPHIDGPTLNNRLRDTIPDLKTIFISGYTEDTFRNDLGKGSNMHFLQKPFTLKDLASKVKEVIAG